MALAQPSRFSVLRDEGSKRDKKKAIPTPITTDKNAKQKDKKTVPKNSKTETEKREKKTNDNNVKKVNPFVNPRQTAPKGSKPKIDGPTQKKNASETEGAYGFIKKYEEAETQEFLKNLEEAIRESKRNYDENKEYYDSLQRERKEEDCDKVSADKKKKNRKKKPKGKTDDLVTNDVNSKDVNGKTSTETFSNEDEIEEAPFVMIKEKRQKKETKTQFRSEDRERDTTDVRLLQYRAELEEKDKQIAKLISEADQMKEEIGNLNKVNVKFCSILEKVRNKVDSITMVEELIKDKDELTQEITNLHASLEQERSKVHSLQLQLRAQGSRKDSK